MSNDTTKKKPWIGLIGIGIIGIGICSAFSASDAWLPCGIITVGVVPLAWAMLTGNLTFLGR